MPLSPSSPRPTHHEAPRSSESDPLFEAKRDPRRPGPDARAPVRLLAGPWALPARGAPGLAKTLAAETIATILGGTFARLQFTPDLVPADLVGTRIYRPSREAFDVELGPVFANVVLADEINRARPRCSRPCSR